MKITKVGVYIILFIGLFIRCSNNESESKIIKYVNDSGQFQIDYYNYGQTLMKSVVFKGSKKGSNYYINKYDTLTGVLLDSIPYVQKKEEGIRKEYFSDNDVFIYSRFVKGIEHGKREGFYKNGKKYMEGNVIEGKIEGEVFFYNSDGRIKSYEFFKNNERVFIMRYDKKYIDGNPILSLVSEKSSESFFEGYFTLPKLLDCEIEVIVCDLIEGELKECVKLDGNKNNEFYYSTSLDTSLKEIYKLPRWTITNTVTGKVFEGGIVEYDLNYYKTK